VEILFCRKSPEFTALETSPILLKPEPPLDMNAAAESLLRCRCNHCAAQLEAPLQSVGTTIPCPHCGLETLLYAPAPSPDQTKREKRQAAIDQRRAWNETFLSAIHRQEAEQHSGPWRPTAGQPCRMLGWLFAVPSSLTVLLFGSAGILMVIASLLLVIIGYLQVIAEHLRVRAPRE